MVIIKTSLSRTYQNETQKYRSWFELHKGESAICTINTQKLSLDMKIYLKYQRAWPLLSCHSFSITMLWYLKAWTKHCHQPTGDRMCGKYMTDRDRMIDIVERLRYRNIQKMLWKINQVLEPICHGYLWKTLLRNAI